MGAASVADPGIQDPHAAEGLDALDILVDPVADVGDRGHRDTESRRGTSWGLLRPASSLKTHTWK